MSLYKILTENYIEICKVPLKETIENTDIVTILKDKYNLQIIDENGHNKKILKDSIILYTSINHTDVIFYPFLIDTPITRLVPLYNHLNLQRFINPTASIIICIKDNCIVYYMKKIVVEKCLFNEMKRCNQYNWLRNLILLNSKQTKIQELNNNLDKIVKNISTYNLDIDLDQDLIKNCKMYKYQMSDVEFIRNLENKVDTQKNKITVEYNKLIECKVGDNYYRYDYDSFYSPYENIHNSIQKLSYQYLGGVLHSEPGLGKTLPFLYHIFDTKKESYVSFNINCNYFYKKGTAAGQYCNNTCFNNSLFCKKHQGTLFIEKRNYKITKQIDNYKNSNATLIICPNHLCDQWVKEFYDKINKNANVLFIVSNHQYKHVKIQDIISADMIVISYQFLVNVNYLKSNSWKFEKIKFTRVIHDEISEVSSMPKAHLIYNTLINIKSKYKWNITGTPFPHLIDSYLANMRLICKVPYYSVTFDVWSQREYNQLDNMISSSHILFRKHTHESIQIEKSQNIITTTYKPLIFTTPERNIYESYMKNDSKYIKNDILIKMCCHVELFQDDAIKKCSTLEEIQKIILNNNYNKIKKLESIIKSKTNKETALLLQVQSEEVKLELSSLRRSISIEQRKVDSLKKSVNYFKNLLQSESCPICLDDIKEAVMTTCGHSYCEECINHIKNNNKTFQCPTCKTLITNNDIYNISPNTNNGLINTEIKTELDQLVYDIKSTKLGNIIYYFKNLPKNAKCILFSQWDYLLDKVGGILSQYLNIVYCKGTVYHRSHAIKTFKTNPDVQLLLLSSKNCASGLNLTEANKIIFLEPINGNVEYRNTIEMQAIGRINRINQKNPIEIIRFYIKDTIEEKIYFD